MTVCSKNSNQRSWSNYIKMIQADGQQHYIHTDGFYAACFTQRIGSMLPNTELLPISVNGSMLLCEYPDVSGAIGRDITKRQEDNEAHIDAGHKILNALKVAKITKETSINPATCELFHDKANHQGCIRAKYLSQFLAVGCVALYYNGTKDDCHSFTLLQGKTSITLFVAGMVSE
jgi:hypothetical protein